MLVAFGMTTAAIAQDATQPAADSAHMHALPEGQVSPYAPAKVAQQPLPKPGDRSCLQTTGSLIPAKPGTCLPVHGNSYTQDDIKRTGEPNTARALQMLDPSITVRGGH
ncbi:hypothetical protein EZM97_19350 [Dyella soli]|uniref:Uncharacterized protein n=1 Tax=Dyella soli TaxID=522319 RepID=A0A4R0YWQ9_9GAMM|nr:hypothetical protein EZM97_19350 [Dyella soli]